VHEIESVGPERNLTDRGASKIFAGQPPFGSPGQEQREPDRDQGETKGAREIVVVAERELAILDSPERRIHRHEQNDAGERAEERRAPPALRITHRQPRADHPDHQGVEAIDDDHAQAFRPGGGWIRSGQRSGDGGKGEEAQGRREKNGIETFRQFQSQPERGGEQEIKPFLDCQAP